MGMFAPKIPTPPPPDPEVVEAQQRQEERLDAQEEQKLRQLEARKRARRTGGQRSLLSPDREVPQTGVGKTKLGSS